MSFCTQCGQEGSGRFCAGCGASLRPIPCPGCGVEVPAGTRFCTACGTPLRARPEGAGGPVGAAPGRASESRIGWFISGGLLAVLLAVVGFAEFSDRGGAPAAGFGGGAPIPTGPVPNVDLSSMTPRQAADQLFNRVMRAVANGDTGEAATFLPMALDAYGLARPLDDDGLFHLSLLQRAAGNIQGSLATALEGLEENPDHLLNLSGAAAASLQLGDTASAREYYGRMLAAWDREIAAGRIEYTEHEPLLPLLREDAEALLPPEGG